MFKPRHEAFAPTDIEAVINETILLLSFQAQRGKIEINNSLPKLLPPINGSAEQLKQVFLNLLINACDFMPNGGRIEISGACNEDHLTLELKDSGPGIPEENLERIFEPFFTTKAGGKGTGLGLSVCYSIVRAHGGTIVAGNVAGGGACFTIELPVRR
jgi:two-component system NtrC family sensor kinase